jgi:hypothetical protein
MPDVVGPAEQDGGTRLATFKTLVESHATSIAEDLERGQRFKRTRWLRPRSDRAGYRPAHDSSAEQDSLAEYDRTRSGALRSFVNTTTATTRPGTLILEEFHKRARPFDQPYAELIAVMLAAHSEANGRIWLERIEGDVIADSLERTGKDLLSAGFPRFAERAFDEATAIHARFRDARAEDRCQHLNLGAHRRTYPWWHPMRFAWELSRWLFGYGYKPMQLLVWITVAIAGFAVYLLHLPRNPGTTRSDALFVSLQNFVSPLGLGDTKSISPKWETPLEVETYTGDILRTVFFVVFIRRWFRL